MVFPFNVGKDIPIYRVLVRIVFVDRRKLLCVFGRGGLGSGVLYV